MFVRCVYACVLCDVCMMFCCVCVCVEAEVLMLFQTVCIGIMLVITQSLLLSHPKKDTRDTSKYRVFRNIAKVNIQHVLETV